MLSVCLFYDRLCAVEWQSQSLSKILYCAEDEGLAAAPGMMTAGAVRFSKSLDLLKLTSPSYLVCLDMMKADLRVRKSVLGQSEASCWQKSFSATLVLSSLLPRGLLSGEPFLHGPGARIESYGSWNRQSSYFHSIQGMVCQSLLLFLSYIICRNLVYIWSWVLVCSFLCFFDLYVIDSYDCFVSYSWSEPKWKLEVFKPDYYIIVWLVKSIPGVCK